jgi:hypothetical protein
MAADISLNGQPLGHATNQFNRYIFSSISNVCTLFSSKVSRIQPFTRLMSSSAGQALTIGSNTLEVSFPLLSQDSRNDEGGGGGRRGAYCEHRKSVLLGVCNALCFRWDGCPVMRV